MSGQLEHVVRALYLGILDRHPDDGDVAHWVAVLNQGTPLEDVVRNFADSEERRQLEQRRPRGRPTPRSGGPELTIVDVGAQVLESEDDVFSPLIDTGGCRVFGFEPLEDSHEARLSRDASLTLLPYYVGDGSRRTFFETVWTPTSSLYEPDLKAMADFEGLAEICSVDTMREVETVRLDDVLKESVDFLKVDVQGAELDVLRGAERILCDTLVVHLEVEFFPIYRAQPLFDEVFRFLVDLGFDLFDLPRLERYRYRGAGGPAGRLLWAEAVFIPTRARLDQLDAERALRIVRIMRDVYGAVDFCRWLLSDLDERLGSRHLEEFGWA